MTEGTVFDISHYMLEDGPGIRTNVFVKGCYLNCRWCSNVYGLKPEIQMIFEQSRCSGCRHCLDVCPQEAIRLAADGQRTETYFSKCRNCMKCVTVCPSGARKRIGQNYTVQQVCAEVERDRMYYRRGEGGVTLSGGEILMQPDFVKEILKTCSNAGINTAIETSGFGKWEDLSEILKYCDTAFIDCKCMNPVRHRELTGVDNGVILENIRKASVQCKQQGTRLVIRLPLIPTLNDDRENILATARFTGELEGAPLLNILPYHNYGAGKYQNLGKTYGLEALKMQTPAELQQVEALLKTQGTAFSIGGYDI